MKVTIVSHYFETADEPGISLLSSLAEHLVSAGHTVDVVCGRFTRVGRTRQQALTMAPGGYTIHRTWSGNETSLGIISRIANFGAFTVSALAGLWRAGRSDVIFASSPPIFPMFTAWLWARLTGASFVLEICDLWPESVVELGVIRNPVLIRLTRWLENFLYHRSDAIICLTEGIAETIRRKNTPTAPILVARCAVDPQAYEVAAGAREAVRRRLGWETSTVALFAGTIGYAQDIATVLDGAGQLLGREDIKIVVLGDGTQRALVADRLDSLPNVELREPVPKREMAELLAAADIGLCPLRDLPLFEGAVPTKLIDYLAAGLPVVGVDMREIRDVTRGYPARLYKAGDASAFATSLRDMADAPAQAERQPVSAALADEFRLETRNGRIAAMLERLAVGSPPARQCETEK